MNAHIVLLLMISFVHGDPDQLVIQVKQEVNSNNFPGDGSLALEPAIPEPEPEPTVPAATTSAPTTPAPTTSAPTTPAATTPAPTISACDPGCQNGGACTGPNVCECNGNWMGNTCEVPCIVAGSQCLYVNTTDYVSWSEARSACEDVGGARLISPDDATTLKTFIDTNYGGKSIWIGASDIQNEGSWVNDNGVPVADGFPWYNGSPDGDDGYDCMIYTYSRAYFSYPCTSPGYFICEKIE